MGLAGGCCQAGPPRHHFSAEPQPGLSCLPGSQAQHPPWNTACKHYTFVRIFNTHIKALFIMRQWLGRCLETRQRGGAGGTLDGVWQGTSTLGQELGRGPCVCPEPPVEGALPSSQASRCFPGQLFPYYGPGFMRGVGRWGRQFSLVYHIPEALRGESCLQPALKPPGPRTGAATFPSNLRWRCLLWRGLKRPRPHQGQGKAPCSRACLEEAMPHLPSRCDLCVTAPFQR